MGLSSGHTLPPPSFHDHLPAGPPGPANAASVAPAQLCGQCAKIFGKVELLHGTLRCVTNPLVFDRETSGQEVV